MVLKRSSRVGLGALVALMIGSVLAVWPLAGRAAAAIPYGVGLPGTFPAGMGLEPVFAPGATLPWGGFSQSDPAGTEVFQTYCTQLTVPEPTNQADGEISPAIDFNGDPLVLPELDYILWKYRALANDLEGQRNAAAIATLVHQTTNDPNVTVPLGSYVSFQDGKGGPPDPESDPVNQRMSEIWAEAQAHVGLARADSITVQVSQWAGLGPARVIVDASGPAGVASDMPLTFVIDNGTGLATGVTDASGHFEFDVTPIDRFAAVRVSVVGAVPGPVRMFTDLAHNGTGIGQRTAAYRSRELSGEAVAQPLPGKVRIRKVSNNPRYQNPVGAQFEVRKSGVAVATLTIGGAPNFESQEVELPAGDDYAIVETVPPANHQLDQQERVFVLDPGESETLDTAATPFTNEPFKARVRVHKTNNNPEYQSVSGASFVLLDNDTGAVVAGSEMVVGASADPAKPGIAESNTVSVYPGTYVLHESVTPSGHFPAVDQVISVPEQASDAEPIEVHPVENTVIPVRFNVQKVSLNKWYQSVAGAQFVLVDELTGIQEPGSEMTIPPAAAGDPPGSAVSNTVSVRARRYILREVVPAVGHFGAHDRVVTLSPQPTVESAAINLTQELVEETPKCKPIYVDKIDSDTRKPVAGVGLTLRRDHDNNGSYETLVGNFVTNGSEPVLAGDCLYEGNYELIEHSAPSPYSLPDTTIHYFHSWDKPLSLVHNDSIPVIFTRATSSGGDVPAELFDRVELSNVPPTAHGSITVNLYFAEPDEPLTCTSSQLVGTWTVPTQGPGSYQSPSHFVHENGTYTYVASYHGRDDQSTATHGCGEPNETVQFDAPVTSTTSTTTTTTTSLAMAPVPVKSAPAFTGADAAGLLGLGATALGSGLALARASRRTGRRSR